MVSVFTSHIVSRGFASRPGHTKDHYKKELQIDCNRMEFERVHRIGKRDNQFAGGRPRPVVARFSRFKDRESIRQAAPRELRGKPFGTNEQFPKCVVERRKRLLPAFKKLRQNPMIRSSLIGDKLFINGRQLSEQAALDYVGGRSTPGHDTAQPVQGGPPPNRDHSHVNNRGPSRYVQSMDDNTRGHAHQGTTTHNRFSTLSTLDRNTSGPHRKLYDLNRSTVSSVIHRLNKAFL